MLSHAFPSAAVGQPLRPVVIHLYVWVFYRTWAAGAADVPLLNTIT